MNKITGLLAITLAVASLVGCGLKGPLYFPPAEKPQQQTPPVTVKQAAQPDDASQTPNTDKPGMSATH